MFPLLPIQIDGTKEAFFARFAAGASAPINVVRVDAAMI